MQFDVPLIRIYFNSWQDRPNVWSIDFGQGSVEILCASVTILDGSVYSVISDKKDLDAAKEARVWFQMESVGVTIDGAFVTVHAQSKKP